MALAGTGASIGDLNTSAEAATLDAIQNAIIVTDSNGRIVFWNKFAEQLYGWSADEVLGSDVNEITPADRDVARGAMSSITDGQTWSGEFMVKRKSGEAFPAFVTTSAMYDTAGRLTGFVGVSFDITQQRERAQSYEALFKTMSEGFAICEAIRDDSGVLTDYLIVEINPALQTMLGGLTDMAGKRLSETDFGDEAWLQLCDRVLRTGEPAQFEFHNPATDKWHEVGISRVSSDRMAQFVFDITEQKIAEARQSSLFDELNHRVKNNLTLVASFLRIQARDASDEARDQLIKAVGRVQSIAQVHDALYRGHRRDTVDFAAYLQNLCASLSQSLIVDQRLTLEVEAEPVQLSIDSAIALGMVVNELVTNAIKYAYPGSANGSVTVRCVRDENAILLTVGDSGRGLPANVGELRGGLGMKLVSSLVDQAGGHLSIRNDAGATFEIRAPIR